MPRGQPQSKTVDMFGQIFRMKYHLYWRRRRWEWSKDNDFVKDWSRTMVSQLVPL